MFKNTARFPSRFHTHQYCRVELSPKGTVAQYRSFSLLVVKVSNTQLRMKNE